MVLNYYLKKSIGVFEVYGLLKGKMVLNATVMAENTQWKKYSP